ncbi:hypothetical protein B0H19DRAFT_1070340 [Mycena capillaripes]|nr:hypothetical protein B0H19DRAFT_1070340 [Mycena capillaripes]
MTTDPYAKLSIAPLSLEQQRRNDWGRKNSIIRPPPLSPAENVADYPWSGMCSGKEFKQIEKLVPRWLRISDLFEGFIAEPNVWGNASTAISEGDILEIEGTESKCNVYGTMHGSCVALLLDPVFGV